MGHFSLPVNNNIKLHFYPRDVVSAVYATATWLAGCVTADICGMVWYSRV